MHMLEVRLLPTPLCGSSYAEWRADALTVAALCLLSFLTSLSRSLALFLSACLSTNHSLPRFAKPILRFILRRYKICIPVEPVYADTSHASSEHLLFCVMLKSSCKILIYAVFLQAAYRPVIACDSRTSSCLHPGAKPSQHRTLNPRP